MIISFICEEGNVISKKDLKEFRIVNVKNSFLMYEELLKKK